MYYQRIQKTYLRQRRPRKGNSLACQQAGKRAVVLSSMSWGLGLVAAIAKRLVEQK